MRQAAAAAFLWARQHARQPAWWDQLLQFLQVRSALCVAHQLRMPDKLLPEQHHEQWVLPGASVRHARGPRQLFGLFPGRRVQVIEPGPWWTPSGA